LRQTHVRLDMSGEMSASEWALFERFADEMSGDCASFDRQIASEALRLLFRYAGETA